MPAKKTLLFAAMSATLIFTSCHSGGGPNAHIPGTVSARDEQFMVNRFSDHNMIIGNSNVAGNNYKNEKVRNYANLANSEFSYGQIELKKLGSQKKMTMPEDDYLDVQDEQATLALKSAATANAKSATFDIAYMDMEISGQQKAIEMLEYQMGHGSDEDVVAYATKYLAKAQLFKKMADSIRAELR